MSNKDTEQKYFVGNWIQHKRHPEWVAFINEVFDNHGHKFFYTAFTTNASTMPFLGQGEIERDYNIIPYPWQLFFKVGDKVKEPGSEKIGTVDHIASKEEIENGFRPIYVIYPGHSRHYFYNPHELIKIGE